MWSMQERELEISTDAGRMRTFIAYPDRGGAHPVALICQDGPGYRDQLKDVARRYATSGYCSVLSDWTYRFGEPVDFRSNPAAAGPEIIRRTSEVLAHPGETLIPDARAAIDYVDGERLGDASRVVTVGYCFGGMCVVHLLSGLPDRVVAAAGFHPNWLGEDRRMLTMHERAAPEPEGGAGAVPSYVLDQLNSIRGELYFGVAEEDRWIPQADYQQFAQVMRARGVRGEVEVYRGTQHGFSIPGSMHYDRNASERHYERTLDLWRRNLA
jgi:carboxymethylenebutenolidase